MKIRHTIPLAGLLILLQAQAQSGWVAIATNDQTTRFVFPETITRDGDKVAAWFLDDFKAPQGQVRSMKGRLEFSCAEHKVRTLSMYTHSGPMATGDVLSYKEIPGAWYDIPPGSSAEFSGSVVCAR